MTKHIDCGQTRATAAAICAPCGQPIGYGVAYVMMAPDAVIVPQHFACAVDAAEKAAR